MFKGWRFSLIGILIVGIVAVAAPLLNLSHFEKTVPLFILFVLFVGALNLLEKIKSKYSK
ncbi:hypothetical protein GCM10010916_33690 [Paenibacillus abyssi]|uniref:Uncharacterized protein n=1 Tax=Paenibacillus abyssi TaxID=1340531 RepID=A0A917LD46_9BACL|nr:hypothetical protein GCM10010916_33690 [Paenibacillus abyssi]